LKTYFVRGYFTQIIETHEGLTLLLIFVGAPPHPLSKLITDIAFPLSVPLSHYMNGFFSFALWEQLHGMKPQR